MPLCLGERDARRSGDGVAGQGVTVERDVRIAMRDGVSLSADVHRPDAAGRFPAILEHIPYRKDDVTGPGRRAIYEELVRRGFAIVRLDVRGTGSSGGIALDEYTEAEQEDGCEATAWAASQDWCTGAVGAWGMSYGGFTAIQLAANRPPALKAIAALYATDDRYTDDMHFFGGALCALELGHYPIRMIAMNALPPAGPLDARSRMEWRERIERTPPWILRWLEEQNDGPYWRNGSLRPDYDRVSCPTLVLGGWRDGYCSAAVRMAERMRVPTEVVIGPWSHVLPDRAPVRPRIDLVELLSSWFERHLAGKDGPGRPSVRVYVQGFDDPRRKPDRVSGRWVGYDGWPRSTGALLLHLHPDGALRPDAPSARAEVRCEAAPSAGVQTGNWCPPPPPDGLPGDQRLDEVHAATFQTDPLAEELTILGFPRLSLSIRHPGPTATVAAKLSDVSPDGISQLVTRAVLNLSHRDSHVEPSAVSPDAFVASRIELNATAWTFAVGHRVRLAISASDWPTVWPAATREPPTFLIDAAAMLEMPLVPGGEQLSDEGPPPPPSIEGARTSTLPETWRLVRDGLAHRVGIETGWGTEHDLDDGDTRVRESLAVSAMASETDPNDATVDAEGSFALERPDVRALAVARGRFTSTRELFRVELSLEVTADGEPFATRRWEATVPRNLV